MAYYDDLKKFKNRIAAIDDSGRMITYSELDMICYKLQHMINSRSLVMSFCENSVGSLIGYIAFLYNKVVPILLDRHIDGELRERLISIYNPEYVYMPEDMKNNLEYEKVIFQENGYLLVKMPYVQEVKMYGELGLLLTTSGSTGSPKLVRQSYDNIQANAESIAEYLGLDETEKPITTLPMNYTYGLSIINSHLLVGATIVMTKYTLMQREFWDSFRKNEATSFGGVPYTYEMLKKLRFFRMELPSLRTMTQAGGKLSPELHKEFAEYAKENGKRFVVMYGQTEATARMAYLPAEYALEKYGSMGKAIPGGKLELIDTNGEVIKDVDTVGELVYSGPNVTLGYAECVGDLSLGDERHGRLETGDMAKCDKDGYFYIVGRKKRFLKIFGNRVNLDETERLIKKQFEDIDCACTGVDDKMSIYVTDERYDRDISSFVSHKLGLHNSAFEVKYIDKIPKNEAGKTLYSSLK